MEQHLDDLHKQAIQQARLRMGKFAWPTVLMVVAVLAVFAVNLWLLINSAIPVWLALLVFGATTYMSYTPLHEAVHDNICGKHKQLQWLNDLCGYLCGTVIAVSYSTHKLEHFTHHRFTNQLDKDPDVVVRTMGDGIWAFFITGLKFLWVQNSFLYREHWHKISCKERMIYIAESIAAISWRLALLAVLPFTTWLLVVVGGYLLGAYFTAYWFAYRPHHPYENTERYQNTNSLIMPRWMKPLEWFWLGQNLHSIHHAFPKVPFYQYHSVFRDIEAVLRAHGNDVIGIFDREAVQETLAR